MSLDEPKNVRCTDCGVTFDFAEIKRTGATACPNCNSTAPPLDPREDVQITINWHELRVLCIWAEHYARKIEKPGAIYSIAQRIEDQVRKPGMAPLTLARELNEIGAKLYDKDGEVQL